jgi:hypothetical protein
MVIPNPIMYFIGLEGKGIVSGVANKSSPVNPIDGSALLLQSRKPLGP